MKDNYIVISVLVGALVLIGGGVYLSEKASQPSQVEKNTQARLAVNNQSYNWGNIPINGGDVEATFVIKNEGADTLQLFNISTSCTCTKAWLQNENEKSPEFGMHTQSRYVMNLSAGESTELRVIFDPAFHGPGGVGSMTRQIMMETNDVSQPEIVFNINGTVV
jgi:hypothetical protein